MASPVGVILNSITALLGALRRFRNTCEKRETRETTERENLSLLSLSRASCSQTKSRLIVPNNACQVRRSYNPG